MNALFQNGLFQNLWSQDLAWTLVHFLWEGAVLGLVAWVGLHLLRQRSANARYLWACSCLGLMLTSAVATFMLLRPLLHTGGPGAVMAVDPRSVHAAMNDAPWPLRAQLAFAPFLPWALAVWSLGVAMLTLRLAGAWLWLQRLRYSSIEPAGAEFQMQLNTLIRHLHVDRAVGLFKSALVEAPLVIGWLRPAILVPVAAITGLTPESLDAVLAHELAHIRRHDYLVNLLQSAVEILFFYHPAVWWLSAEIRAERENACDDVAVSSCGDALFYARSLARLEELRGSSANPALALASNGGSLMNRIHRLLVPSLPPSNTARAGLLAALAFSLLGATTYKITQAPAPKAGESKSQKVSKVVVRTGDRNMDVNMDGDVKLDPGSKEFLKLGPGGSIELKVREGGKLKKFTARKDAKGEVREWTVDGKAAPMTPEDETWLKEHLKELKRLGSNGARSLDHHVKKIIIEKDGDSEVKGIEGLEGLGELSELDAQSLSADVERMRLEGMKQIVIETKRMAKDAESQAKDAAKRAKEFRIIVRKNKESAEQMRQLGEEMRKDVRVFVDTDDLDIPETIEDGIPQPDGGLPRKRRMRVLHLEGMKGEENRKAEIEILQREIERMKARLDRLQKDEAAPRSAPMRPMKPMPPLPPAPPSPPVPPSPRHAPPPPPPPDAAPPAPAPPNPPLPPTPPEAPAPGGAS